MCNWVHLPDNVLRHVCNFRSVVNVPICEVAKMPDRKDSCGYEWHLEFNHAPDYPYPFPIVPAGTRDKHDAVGHLSSNGRVHVFNNGIIERLICAGLRARV